MTSLLQRLAHQFTRERLSYRYRQIRNRFADPKTLWDAGIAEEINFWREVMTDPNNVNYPLVRDRVDPMRPLDERFTTLLNLPEGSQVRILDMGSGPVTVMGYRWEGRTVEMNLIDALADEYNRLLDEAGLQPPVRPIQCHAEQIAERFEAGTFDLIHSFNALDHAYNPLLAVQQALMLLKPGGWIYLRHKVNEGKRIYGGLHQWNFCEEDGEFIIWNMQQRFCVRDHLNPLAQLNVRTWNTHHTPMVDVTIQKQ